VHMLLCGCGARIAWSDAHCKGSERQVWSLLKPEALDPAIVTGHRMRRVEFKGWDCRDNFKQNPMGQVVSSPHQWPRLCWYGKHDGTVSMVISVFLPPHRHGVWISPLAMEAMGLLPSQRGFNGSVSEHGMGMAPLAHSARLEELGAWTVVWICRSFLGTSSG
jgi:hypothetical protein